MGFELFILYLTLAVLFIAGMALLFLIVWDNLRLNCAVLKYRRYSTVGLKLYKNNDLFSGLKQIRKLQELALPNSGKFSHLLGLMLYAPLSYVSQSKEKNVDIAEYKSYIEKIKKLLIIAYKDDSDKPENIDSLISDSLISNVYEHIDYVFKLTNFREFFQYLSDCLDEHCVVSPRRREHLVNTLRDINNRMDMYSKSGLYA